ncbi:unnamed protein product [Soboliphyme baturini]|uniref:Ig-like domain-containing protein n=1 Tax=Soboliphyme baturini TaxID=241478 RepID=A0A183ICP7_9BILA|nr:unnamed protein product [Soboliphyme baturini]
MAVADMPVLSISPHFDHVVRKEGSPFVIRCTVSSDDGFDHEYSISWKDPQGNQIPSSSKYRIHVLEPPFRKSRTSSLLFSSLQRDDQGAYVCEATSGAQTFTQTYTIHVMQPMSWLTRDPVVGGLLEEPLPINCVAEGVPAPDVTILMQEGKALPDQRFTVVNNVLTIDPLLMDDRGLVIECTATQISGDEDYSNVEHKLITVDVYYPPKFEESILSRYGIPGKNATFPCAVKESNPPVIDFQFWLDSRRIQDDDKYQVEVNLLEQRATLHLRYAEYDDFTRPIKCKATNGKAESELSFVFKEATTPESPQAAFLSSSDHSVTFRIVDDLSDAEKSVSNVPITEYRVHFIPAALLAMHKNRSVEDIWRSNATVVHVKKTEDNQYTVGDLKPATKYAFRFQSVNEAGWSEHGATLLAETVTVSDASLATTPLMPMTATTASGKRVGAPLHPLHPPGPDPPDILFVVITVLFRRVYDM